MLQLVGVSVAEHIQNPEYPFALRLRSHLLLGCVRVYHKQLSYLLEDVVQALDEIRRAFGGEKHQQRKRKKGATTASKETNVANRGAITVNDRENMLDEMLQECAKSAFPLQEREKPEGASAQLRSLLEQ